MVRRTGLQPVNVGSIPAIPTSSRTENCFIKQYLWAKIRKTLPVIILGCSSEAERQSVKLDVEIS